MAHRKRPEEENYHPIWESFKHLENQGLITFVPHLWEGDPRTENPTAQIIHSYAYEKDGRKDELDIERELGQAAHHAAGVLSILRQSEVDRRVPG